MVKQRGAAVCSRHGSPRTTQGRECTLQSQASRRLLLPRRTPNWQAPPQRPTHCKLTTVPDPNGNTTSNAYNSLNELASTINALRGGTGYAYDKAGDLTSTTDPLGFTNTYSYNAMGWMTGQTLQDALGTPGVYSTYSYAYDAAGNQTAVTDPLNHATTYGYNAVNEQTSVTNPLGQTTTYDYNPVGEQTSVTDALGDKTSYAYNAAGEQTSMTDPLGNATTYGYDAAGEQISVTDPLGNEIDYTYNAVGEMSSQRVFGHGGTLVQQIRNSYDPDGNLLSTATVNLYGYAGQNISGQNNDLNDINVSGTVTGVLGGSFTGTFSGSFSDPVLTSTGQVIGDYTVVLGGIISGTLSNVGVLSGTDTVTVTVTFSDGLSGSEQFTVTSNNFSGQNNGGSGTVYGSIPFSMGGSVNSLGGASGPLNGSFGLDFSTAGETSGSYSTPYSGLLVQGTSYSYNALGEQTTVTDALGHATTYGYDADGNVTTVTDPDGNTTTTTYNGLNEPVNVTNETCGCAGKSGTTTYNYNDAGQQTSVIDPSGNQTSYTYDGQGRQLTVTDVNGITSYAYDLAGNQTSETDPAFNTTSYAYNAANERTSTTEPQAPNNPATYAYNPAGELTSATDPDGRTITYAYDKAGRMTSESWVGGNYTATYNYNNDGELTSVSDPNSAYSYTYDALGQQTSVSNAGTPGVPAVTLDYSYDSFGNRTSLTDSLGGSIGYAYNAGNEMTSLGLSLSSTTLDAQVTLAYDGAGNVTGITRTAPSASNPHTIATSYSYNHSNELTNIKYMDTTASVTLANYTYGYNPAGVLTSYQDNSGNSLTYGYDANTELTSATGTLAGSSDAFTYNYGRNGNRTSTSTDVNGTLTSASYTTGSGNELQSDGTYSYTYDNNGNMLTQTNIATGSVTYYTWDYENRLTEVRTGTSDEKFTYDVFGDRIGVSLNGTQQLFTVYDGSNPYMDFSGSGTLTERYLTNPNGLNQFFGQVNASGTTQWFVTDNLGSIRQVVDSSGNVLDAITYDPYGNIISQTSATYAPRFMYTGAAYDPITGTYLDGVREDNPMDGRWESQDPLGLKPDSNPYRYVSNDPTNAIDPTGMSARTAMGSNSDVEETPISISRNGIPFDFSEGNFIVLFTDSVSDRDWIRGIPADNYVRGITSRSDFIDRLTKYPPGHFDAIVISGHGSAFCGARTNSGDNIGYRDLTTDQWIFVASKLKPNGPIIFAACNAAAGGPGNPNQLEMLKLAKLTGHPVIAPIGDCYSGGTSNRPWVIAYPNGKKTYVVNWGSNSHRRLQQRPGSLSRR